MQAITPVHPRPRVSAWPSGFPLGSLRCILCDLRLSVELIIEIPYQVMLMRRVCKLKKTQTNRFIYSFIHFLMLRSFNFTAGIFVIKGSTPLKNSLYVGIVASKTFAFKWNPLYLGLPLSGAQDPLVSPSAWSKCKHHIHHNHITHIHCPWRLCPVTYG